MKDRPERERDTAKGAGRATSPTADGNPLGHVAGAAVDSSARGRAPARRRLDRAVRENRTGGTSENAV